MWRTGCGLLGWRGEPWVTAAGETGARQVLGYLRQDQMLSAAMAMGDRHLAPNPSRRDEMERIAFKIIHWLQMALKKRCNGFSTLFIKGSSPLAWGHRVPPGAKHSSLHQCPRGPCLLPGLPATPAPTKRCPCAAWQSPGTVPNISP